MKNSLLNPVVLVLAAGILVGCAKDVPSCGDVDATNKVGEILAGQVTDDMGAFEEEFKKRVHFSVEQPVVVAHDEKISSYSCKAVAAYKVPDELIKKLQRADTDPKYQAELWGTWRKMINLYSLGDITSLVSEFTEASKNNDPRQTGLREELSKGLGIDKNFNDQTLGLAILTFPVKARTKELQQYANVYANVLGAMDKKTNSVPIEVQYTISKIDSTDKNFKVETLADSDSLRGIQQLELLLTATQRMVQPVTAQTTPAIAPAQQTAPASQPVVEAQPVAAQQPSVPSAPVAAQAVPEAKSQAVVQPEAAIEASFDCTKASSKIEKLICASPETANADKRLSVAYSAARAKSGDASTLKTDQMAWMKQQRNACDDAACLMKVTGERIQALSQM